MNPGREFAPLGPRSVFKGRLVFLVNHTSWPQAAEILDVLQARRAARILFERTGHFLPSGDQTIYFSDGIEVQLGTRLLLSLSGGLDVTADHVADSYLDDAELARIVRVRPTKPVSARGFSPNMTFAPDFPPNDGADLDRETRLHGWFKLWTVISFFYPQLANASVDWQQELGRAIPLVEAAASTNTYMNILQQLTAPLNDSHVFWNGPLLPTNMLPATLRLIEQKAVITAVHAYGDGSVPPLAPGDIITARDGEPVEAIIAAHARLTSASTPGARDRTLMRALGSTSANIVELTIERGGERRQVQVRSERMPIAEREPVFFARRGTICILRVHLITGPRMYDALREAQRCEGLVFDARGLPLFGSSGYDAGAHLLREAAPFPRRHAPVSSGPDRGSTMWTDTSGMIEPHPTLRYTGPLVVLIDETNQSSLENMVFPLRLEGRARFVGSRTAGTTGDTAQITLPGGATVRFTGVKPTYPDDRPFQNVGIVPDVEVTPTIVGVRAGRDEVLEAGLDELRRMLSKR